MNKEVKEYAIEKTKELIGAPTRGGNGRGERGNETIYSGTGYPEFEDSFIHYSWSRSGNCLISAGRCG